MKENLSHLPQRKRHELARIVSIIREAAPQAEMIILFGSYARGQAVEDTYVEDGITYEYKSDFDILVIVETNRTANSTNIWRRLAFEYC